MISPGPPPPRKLPSPTAAARPPRHGRPHATFSHRHGHPQAQPSSSQITARRRPIPPSPCDSAAPPSHPRALLLLHPAIPKRRRHPTPPSPSDVAAAPHDSGGSLGR
ncbi:hypothetical protein ACQJBY_022333 [Aegilops geniculata]